MNIVEYTEYLVKSLVEDPEMIKVEEFMIIFMKNL